MGQQDSKVTNEEAKAFQAQYENFRKITDDRLGELTLLRHKETGELLAQKAAQNSGSNEDSDRNQMYEQRKNMKHYNIAAIRQIFQIKEELICGSVEKVNIFFDFYKLNMEQDIKLRSAQNLYYTTKQAWQILTGCISALAYFNKNGIIHGDITPSSIFLDHTMVPYIFDNQLLANKSTGYLRFLTEKTQLCYLAPAEISSLKTKNYRPKHDAGKSDVFSLGMTLIHAFTLTNIQDCYNFQSFQVNLRGIQEKLGQIQQRYDIKIVEALTYMLIMNENERPSAAMINNELLKVSVTTTTSSQSQQQSQPQPQQRPEQVNPHQQQKRSPYHLNNQDEVKQEQEQPQPKQQQKVVKQAYSGYYQQPGGGAYNHFLQKTEQNNDQQQQQQSPHFQSQQQQQHQDLQQRQQQQVQQGYQVPFTNYTSYQNVLYQQQLQQQQLQQPQQQQLQYSFDPQQYQKPLVQQQPQPSIYGTYKPYQRLQQPSTTSQQQSQQSQQQEETDNVIKEIPMVDPEKKEEQEKHHEQPEQVEESQEQSQEHKQSPQQPKSSQQPQSLQQPQNTITRAPLIKTSPLPKILSHKEWMREYTQKYKNSSFQISKGLSPTLKTTVQTTNSQSQPPNQQQQQYQYTNYYPSNYGVNLQQQQPSPSQSQSQEQFQDIITPSIQPLPEQQEKQEKQTISHVNNVQDSLKYSSQKTTSFEMQSNKYVPVLIPYTNVTYDKTKSLESQQNKQYVPVVNPYANVTQSMTNNSVFGLQGRDAYKPYLPYQSNFKISKTDGDQFQLKTVLQVPQQVPHEVPQQVPQQQSQQQQVVLNQVTTSNQGQPSPQQVSLPYTSPQKESQQAQPPQLYGQVGQVQALPIHLVTNVTEHYRDGSIYEGEKENGLRHGNGKFSYADGGVYDGDWKFGAMDGYGNLYYPNQKLAYEGQWQNNAFNGKGKVFNEEPQALQGKFNHLDFDDLGEHWEFYEGEFVNDAKQGVGTLMLMNGEKYIGSFYEDMIHGRGSYHGLNGEMISGEWASNQFVKKI